MSTSCSLDIVIVNWNAGHHLRRCLESIASANRSGFDLDRVVLVDNDSDDGSADGLDDLDLPMVCIRNQANRGFAAACNQGAAGSAADYVLFLNPDVVLFNDSLSVAVHFLALPANNRVGICGIQLVDEGGVVWRSCARFPTPGIVLNTMLGLDQLSPRRFPGLLMREWDHGTSRPVDIVIGAFMLVRRALFNSLNGFDERFFVYLEDVDFPFRAHQSGWSSCYLTSTQAFHKGGGSSQRVGATRLFYSTRSRILYGYKHFTPLVATGLASGTLILEPIVRLAYAGVRRSPADMVETLRGFGRLWRAAPQILNSQRGRKT